MTTSKPPWPSTVSCLRNPRALPGRLGFPGPWHARTPRNASCTDFRLWDRRSPPCGETGMAGSLSGPVAAMRREHLRLGAKGILSTFALPRGAPAPKNGGALTTSTRLVRPADAPGEAGTAGPAPHRVIKGSQPTQCMTLGLARGSAPSIPDQGELPPAPHHPRRSLLPLPGTSSLALTPACPGQPVPWAR